MEKSYSASYAAAGVDITSGYRAVELMQRHIARTVTQGVLGGVGGFGGLFELDTRGMERPVLVSGTDGVGTKLRLAFLMDKHDTVAYSHNRHFMRANQRDKVLFCDIRRG